MSFIPNPNEDVEVEEGGEKRLRTTDMSTEQLLVGILFELKKLNLHMRQVSDLDVSDRDCD